MEPERPEEAFCSPGFVDLQLNGIAGVNFSSPELTPELAITVLKAVWSTGVTSFCPTLTTSPLDLLERNFRILEDARKKNADFATLVACYHLEGPYLSPTASGAHDPQLLRVPSWAEFERLQAAAGNRIGILTIAPELPEALHLISLAVQTGVVVAIGHTDAIPSEIHAAVKAGARLSTHLGNGYPEFIHRHRSPIWPQLISDDLCATTLTMDRAVRNYQILGRTSLEAAIAAASTNPARLLGREDALCLGMDVGNSANLTIWRQGNNKLQIDGIYIKGILHTIHQYQDVQSTHSEAGDSPVNAG